MQLSDKASEPASIQPENSLLFRLLVQALVSVGIIATDIAAGTWMSLWAVPLSLLGAFWSWRQRNRKNVATKFWLAFGMLVALGAFSARLLGSLNDTRLVLAELLVHLQVLHSFDLPRRKDLGYSMVIGLILLGVAGTLSQTSVFGLLLLLFLAIALPTLVLDYRSRLGLTPRQPSWNLNRTELAPKQLGLFFLAVLVLGFGIFAALPRLPGYQLRTFPVSSTIDFEGQFDSQRISNPGYMREGSLSVGTTGAGTGAGSGSSGQVDDTFYYGFNSRMNQNLRGQMKPQVVMRVRSQSPGFWRVLAFDHYTGQGWEISRNDKTMILNRDNWSYRFGIPTPRVTGQTKDVVQTYTLVSELPNLIPVLPNAKFLYFPTRQIGIDTEGSLRSPIALTEDLTYTAISSVPFRDRERLQRTSTDYPDTIRSHYLEVPETLAVQLRDLAQKWLAKANSPLQNPYEQALYLTQYLKQHFTVQPDLPFLAENQDLASAFLFQFRGGYPDHFSTVLTLMLRSLGIPARLAAGFGPGQFNPFTGFYVVRNTDAYALTEVYFPEQGWFTFDPIPGHALFPPSVEDNQTFSVLKQFWSWVAGWIPTPVSGIFGAIAGFLLAWGGRILGWFFALFTQGGRGIFIGLSALIGLGFLMWLSWINWRQWQHRRWLASLPPMESLYQQMLTWLEHQGLHKHPAQTPLEFAQYMNRLYPTPSSRVIQLISQAYVSWRYGNQVPNLTQLRQQLQALKKAGFPKADLGKRYVLKEELR